jgi:hypothetical protein
VEVVAAPVAAEAVAEPELIRKPGTEEAEAEAKPEGKAKPEAKAKAKEKE